jgi:hypothetical protein
VSDPQPVPVDPDMDLHVPAHRAEVARQLATPR